MWLWYGGNMKTRARAISYFLSVTAIAAIFFSVEFVTEKYFYPNDEVVDILAAIVGALSFAPCKQFFDRATDRIFSRGPRDERAEFLSNVSHELQTPIAILRGNIEVLQSGCATGAERTMAERVIVSTLDGMSRLIGNVLESARVRFSNGTFREEDIMVGLLLCETHEDCFLLAEDKGVGLFVDADAGVGGDLLVRGNRDRLKEVLFNLISNALKHTPRGGAIVLHVERAGAAARIIVQDSGCGIAPEVLPHIFERFYRIENRPLAFADGDASPPPAEPSHGIGLNICREIVEAHKGTIGAESERGKGSRFIISLPLTPPASPPRKGTTPGARLRRYLHLL
jgi:signal transduction histidine kinase